MKDLSSPLTSEEIDRLDRLLLDHVDEEADTEGRDTGILGISDLDGFFTALVSGPVTIMPSRWLLAVWGDFEPVWKDMKDFEACLSLMMRHMNSIAAWLMEQPAEFEPIFLERVHEGKTVTIVDEWCEGYMRGVSLAADRWEAGGLEMAVLLAPIRAFTSETDWQAHNLSTDAEIDNVRNAIVPNVREIHAWWLVRREVYAPVSLPASGARPRVGRNDPCPCGSGKKYKKCCLQ